MIVHFITFTVSKVLIVTGKDTFDHIGVSEVIDLSIKGDNQCFDWFDYPLNISEATGGLVSSNATQGYENRYNLINIDNEKEQMLPLLSTIQLKKSSGQVPDLQKLSRISFQYSGHLTLLKFK